jgi:hypothetical protein
MRYLALLLLSACTFDVRVGDESGPQTVAFEFEMSGADEQSGTVMIPVVLSRPAEEEVTVEYSLLNGNNATANVDFELKPGTLRFAIGEKRKEVPVTIKDDSDETEAAETFVIALSSPHGAQLDEARAVHSVRISDHVLPRVTLDPTPTTTSEANQTMLVIHLDKPAEGTSTVVVGVAGGTPAPTQAADMMLSDGTQVTINDGQMTVLVPIGEQDDNLDEEDPEVAIFEIRGPSTNLVLGTSKTQQHSITDNDNPPAIGFTMPPMSSVDEPNTLPSTKTVAVVLSNASGRVVKVDFAGDANDTAGVLDATILNAPGTLTFDPGETSKNITLIVGPDNIDEDDETAIIQLSNAQNATLSAATHTCTIVDDDTASVAFQNTSATVDEDSNGGINITVRLSIESAKIVQVPFTVSSTNADAGDDYVVETNSPLTFNPGTTQQTISIDVPSNGSNGEGNEQVKIDLGAPTGGATLGTNKTFTLTITE